MATPKNRMTLQPAWWRCPLAIKLPATVAFVLFGLSATVATVAEQAPIETTSGPVAGLPADKAGILAYLGIPYAEPPIGEWRFLPPRPARRSQQLLRADKFGPVSAQRSENLDPQEYGDLLNEDSLTLNVWTPGLTGKRPVMVWIHGGGNTQGSSGTPDYNASRLARTGDVVVVSLNYRLGIFGFADVSVIGGDRYKQSANNGLLDQLLALEWVRRNIAGFGGDPQNVTVFGNSAGASDISALLAVRSPERYFRRAIIQSGFASATRSKAVAQRFSRRMFERANIRSMQELLAKSTTELLAIQSAAIQELPELEKDASFQPTVDGTLIQKFPIEAIRDGNARGIDLILGATANELRLYLMYNPEWSTVKLTDIIGVQDLPQAKRRELWEGYRRNRPGITDGQVALDIGGDYVFRISAIRMAEAQFAHNKNVFMYLFTWQAAAPELGSPHAIEVPFVFGIDAADSSESPYLGNLEDPKNRANIEAVVGYVQQYWTSFARSGTPTSRGGPQWLPYDIDHRRTLVVDRTLQLVPDPYASERQLFDGLNLVRAER